MAIALLLPPSKLARWTYPAIFGAPLIVAALWRGQGRAFRLWALYAVSFVAFVQLRFYADDIGPLPMSGYAIAVDRVIGLGILPTLRLQAWTYTYPFGGWLEWTAIGIYLSYYAAPALMASVVWLQGTERLARYVVAFGLLYAASIILHAIVPTVPPWLAGIRGDSPPVHRIVHDLLHGASSAYYRYGNYVAGGNDVAAMPSVHFGAAVLTALGLADWRGGRILGAVYAIAMGWALVYLGEHYVVDLLVGGIVVGMAWRAAARIAPRLWPDQRNAEKKLRKAQRHKKPWQR